MNRMLFSTLPRHLLAALMVVGVGLNTANVAGRYLLGAPIFWAEEVMVYLMIWGIFIGLVAVTFEGEHIAMDLIGALLPDWLRGLRDAIAALAIFACALFVAAQSWKVVHMFIQTGGVTASAGVPKAIPHAAILVGFGLVALAAVLRIRAFHVAARDGNLLEKPLP